MKQLYLRSRSLKHLFFSPSPSRIYEKRSAGSAIISGKDEPAVKPVQKPTWRCFSYEEIHRATNGFHKNNLVGTGGYAEVFRGELQNGQIIAVKRLTTAATDEQKEKEFLTELGTVGHVRHPNVTAFLGCCIDHDLHLIFEFSSRGSVSSNLHNANSPPMEWKLRYKIVVGTARGLHYLHKGCQRRIIHRDIKTSNVLLSASFEPQISDFGLAKWLPLEWNHRSVAPIEGTFGCLAPEYFTHGIVDEKTDVFAFGVFILEMISGRKPVDGSHKSLLSWVFISIKIIYFMTSFFYYHLFQLLNKDNSLQAKPYLNDGKLEMLVDARLGEDYDINQLKRLTFIASLCIRASATWRPSMTEVLDIINNGDMSSERWKMPESEEDEDDEFWIFNDLDDCDSPTSSSLSSMGSS